MDKWSLSCVVFLVGLAVTSKWTGITWMGIKSVVMVFSLALTTLVVIWATLTAVCGNADSTKEEGKEEEAKEIASVLDEKVTLFWKKGLCQGCLPGKPTQVKVPEEDGDPVTRFYEVLVENIEGSGAFGLVVLGKHLQSSTPCAVKIVDLDEAGPDYLRVHRKRDNFNTLLEMTHANTVKYLDFLMTHKTTFVVMERLSGPDLAQDIRQNSHRCERYAKNIIKQALLAVQYTHKNGVIHRDVKVENFKFRSEEKLELVLMDYGWSCPATPQEDRIIVGTLPYMAPEIFSEHYTEKVDLWAVGIMLYIMLVGIVPFKHDLSMNEPMPHFTSGEVVREFQHCEALRNFSVPCAKLVKSLLTCEEHRVCANEALENEWLEIQQSPERPSVILPEISPYFKYMQNARFSVFVLKDGTFKRVAGGRCRRASL